MSNESPREEENEDVETALPAQFGHRRYIYAVFFALGIGVAFVLSRVGIAIWHSLSQWNSRVGEPREDLVVPIAAIFSIGAVFAIYRMATVRRLSDEVALELSKVDWPTGDRARRSTVIVVVATIASSFTFWIYENFAKVGVTIVTESKYPIIYAIGAGFVIYLIQMIFNRFLGEK
jgi:preprotein translocase subunit SecE